jgi:hypothetical protein
MARVVTAPEIAVGPVRKSGIPVLAIDMRPMRDELGLHVDGIVGLDVLAPFNFTIDYERKILEFTRNEGGRAIPAELRRDVAPYLLINAEIGGETKRLLVDTGTDTLAMLTGPGCAAESIGSDGRATLRRTGREIFRAAGIDFGQVNKYVRCKRSGEDDDFDGLFGPRALPVSSISFDFENHFIFLRQ